MLALLKIESYGRKALAEVPLVKYADYIKMKIQ